MKKLFMIIILMVSLDVFAGQVATAVFQLFANLMALLFSTVQAFVFTLLTAVYIYTMSPHDDHAHDHNDQAAGHHKASAH